ncbi:invasion associated locus B family protein [Hasllibacter sp. MH4015]|uniref:invasion associated locus B family protein n=1 Tax=Hasllibacter sp. MH4015 TaxID=2854029 RepID=UPI001CD77494|nr:invasion associated locus B family protein [Hasllibacter sp. MH4015]
MYRLLTTLILLAFSGPAWADWTFTTQGQAQGPGARVSLVVECGNGGLPGFVIAGHDPGAAEEIFVLRIDDNPEDLYFGQCTGATCLLDMDTIARAQDFIAQLRAGSVLDIGLYRRGALDSIPLAGSAAALDRLAATGCGF